MRALGAETAGAVRAALELAEAEPGDLYEIERSAYEYDDETELQRMTDQLGEANLSAAEFRRRRRRILKKGEDVARKQAHDEVVEKGEWGDLPGKQQLPDMSLQSLLDEDGGAFYYSEDEKTKCEREVFQKIKEAIHNFLGEKGRFLRGNLGEDGALNLDQLGAFYNATQEHIKALETQIETVSNDADQEIQKLKDYGHEDQVDQVVVRVEKAIDDINASIDDYKRRRDEKMEELKNKLEGSDTVYDYIFGRGPGNAFEHRRTMAANSFRDAMKRMIQIREGARRTRTGRAAYPGRGESIQALIDDLKKLMQTLQFVQALEGERQGDKAANEHKEAFWGRRIRKPQLAGTKEVRDKKALKEIVKRNAREESQFKQWVDWKRKDPRIKKSDQVRKNWVDPPPKFALLRGQIEDSLFSSTFLVYAQVLNNLVLINFKTEMSPWTWQHLMTRLKDGYAEFYVKSTRWTPLSQKARLQDPRTRDGLLGMTKPDGDRQALAASRIEPMDTVDHALILVPTTGSLKKRIDEYNAKLVSAITKFEFPEKGYKAVATKKRQLFKELEDEWMSATLMATFREATDRPKSLIYWVKKVLGDKERPPRPGNTRLEPSKFEEYVLLESWAEGAISEVMPDAWDRRERVAELLISEKAEDRRKAIEKKEEYMRTLDQAFEAMEAAENEYIGDLNWKKDLLQALYLGTGSLPDAGNLYHTTMKRNNPSWPRFLDRLFNDLLQRKVPGSSEKTYWDDRMPKDELELIETALGPLTSVDAAMRMLKLDMAEKQGMATATMPATGISEAIVVQREVVERLLRYVVPSYAEGEEASHQMKVDADNTMDVDEDGPGEIVYDDESTQNDPMQVDVARMHANEEAANNASSAEGGGYSKGVAKKVDVDIAPRGGLGSTDTHGQAKVVWRFVRDSMNKKDPGYRKGKLRTERRRPMNAWPSTYDRYVERGTFRTRGQRVREAKAATWGKPRNTNAIQPPDQTLIFDELRNAFQEAKDNRMAFVNQGKEEAVRRATEASEDGLPEEAVVDAAVRAERASAEYKRRYRNLDDLVKWTSRKLAEFLAENPKFRKVPQKDSGLTALMRRARLETDNVKHLEETITKLELERDAKLELLERVKAAQREGRRLAVERAEFTPEGKKERDGKTYYYGPVKQRPDGTEYQEVQEELAPDQGGGWGNKHEEPFDRRRFEAERQRYDEKEEFHDREALNAAIARVKAELLRYKGKLKELDKDGATLPLALPQAMQTRGRERAGAPVVPLNRPKPPWLEYDYILSQRQKDKRDGKKMTKEKMDTETQKRYDALVAKGLTREAELMTTGVLTLPKDEARIKQNLYAHFDIEFGNENLLPGGVQMEDCLIKSMLVKNESKYEISGEKFMEFFRRVNDVIRRGIGAAALELMVERMVSESTERSKTATLVRTDEIKDSATWKETMGKTIAARKLVHDEWVAGFNKVFENMGVSKEDVQNAAEVPKGLEFGKLAKNLTRRMWRATLDPKEALSASWDKEDEIGTTFGLTTIFSAVGGRTLPKSLDFLCDIGMVSMEKISEDNMYAPGTQFGQYVLFMKGENLFGVYTPEEAFRALWVRNQMAPGSEWKDALEKKLQVRARASREARDAMAQAETRYFEEYKQKIGEAAWNAEVTTEKANAVRAITRRDSMVPYENSDALARAKLQAAEKAVARLEAGIRKEGRDQFLEQRNVLVYAQELWKKRVFARTKKIPESAAERQWAAGYLEMGPAASSGGALPEAVGYDKLADALAKIPGLQHPVMVARRIKEAVDERIKTIATTKAPFPAQAPGPESTTEEQETYEKKVAQHYAALQMTAQNFLEPEYWVSAQDSRLPLDQMDRKRMNTIGSWFTEQLLAIMNDLQRGEAVRSLTPQQQNALLIALRDAQKEAYKMRYEMGSMEERRKQALEREKALLGPIPTYVIIPEVPPSVMAKLYEIARGDISAQTGVRTQYDPETGRPLAPEIRFTNPQKTEDRKKAKARYETALLEYDRSKSMLNGLEEGTALEPTDENRANLASAKAATESLWNEAKERRREYEFADGEYQQELDGMINALFEQEEELRKNADYAKRKSLFQYWNESSEGWAAERVEARERKRRAEGWAPTSDDEQRSKRAELTAKKKAQFADPDATIPLQRTASRDPIRFGTIEEKRAECRGKIADMITKNTRRKWWNEWLEQNPDVEVDQFKMVVFDESCREYVENILDSFNTYFDEGIIVLKNDDSTQELKELASEVTQREQYRAWEVTQQLEELRGRLASGEQLTDDELMFVKGFRIDNAPQSVAVEQVQLAMKVRLKQLKRHREVLERQRDSLESTSPNPRRQQLSADQFVADHAAEIELLADQFVTDHEAEVEAERNTLSKVLEAVKELKNDVDVSEAVLENWVHPVNLDEQLEVENRVVNRKFHFGTDAYGRPQEVWADRVAEQVQKIEYDVYKAVGKLKTLSYAKPEDLPQIAILQASIADLEKQWREYRQVLEWGRPFELQPNEFHQVKDSFANAIAKVKRQIYFVDVILGNATPYGTPGTGGLPTKEQVLEQIDSAPEERFRLDAMVREAIKAQRTKDKPMVSRSAAWLKEVTRVYSALLSNPHATEEQLENAKREKEAAEEFLLKERAGAAMPDLQEIEMFSSSSALDRAEFHLAKLMKAKTDGQGSSQSGQSELEKEIADQAELILQMKTRLATYRTALMQQLAVLAATYSSDGFANRVDPSLQPYAKLNIGPAVYTEASEDVDMGAETQYVF